MSKTHLIKTIYTYLVSFVSLMMVIIALGNVINSLLLMYVFPKADKADYAYYPEPAGCMQEPVKGGDPSIKPMSVEDCAKAKEENKKRAAEEREAQRQRDLVRDLSMIIVGAPLFALHWFVLRKKVDSAE